MNYLVVDIEATCSEDNSIPKNEMETIEIGAVMVHENLRTILSQFQILIRPVLHKELTSFCVELTGIRQCDVNNAMPFKPAWKVFREWASAFWPFQFCSWGKFDQKILMQDLGREFPYYESWMSDHLDLSSLFKRETGKKKGHRGAMKVLGIEPEGRHHRGLDDALNIAKMLPVLLEDQS